MADGLQWNIEGVRPECREAAKIAARRAGLELGDWLNRTIMNAVRDELGGSQKERSGSQLPALPMAELVRAIELLAREFKDQGVRSVEQMERQGRELTERALAPIASNVATSVADLERSLGDRLDKLQALGSLVDRVQETEDKAERANLAVGPLERSMLRMSERLDRLDQDKRRGLLGRLFGR